MWFHCNSGILRCCDGILHTEKLGELFPKSELNTEMGFYANGFSDTPNWVICSLLHSCPVRYIVRYCIFNLYKIW